MAYRAHQLDAPILDLLKDGEKTTTDIVAINPEKERIIKRRLGILKQQGKIEMPKRSLYQLATSDTSEDSPNSEKKIISRRTANEETIDKLLNLYDLHLGVYERLLKAYLASGDEDFDKYLACLTAFKSLTLIIDKLMKRWSLVHVGYDTNTRQAQEDAKAKTEERQKEALKNAPLEDKIVIVGSYDPAAKELIDCIPSSIQ